MRTRIYIDGIPAWSPNQPSYARLSGIRGSLVTGGSGVVERGRAHKRVSRQGPLYQGVATGEPGRPQLSPDIEPKGHGNRYATDDERVAARRQSWREASRRRRGRAA